MALRERGESRSVKGRHRAAPASTRVAVPAERTSHRWTSVEAEQWAARRARWAEWIPGPRRAPDPAIVPAPRRAVEDREARGASRPPHDHRARGEGSGAQGGHRGADTPHDQPGARHAYRPAGPAHGRSTPHGPTGAGRPRSIVGGMRAEAARVASAGLTGALLATAVLTRATGQQPEPGVEEAPVDPWGRRTMPVRYRPLPRRRRRMPGMWILLVVLLVTAVGAIPSALRDPAVRATATESPVVENVGGGGGGGGGPVTPAPAEFTDQLPDGRAQVAIDAALSQVGVPYQWGGNGPAAGDQGFDCSGLTAFAYAAAGIALPRTAHTQYAAGPHVPPDVPLQPGDLVFYGSPAAVHHVGLYLGDGRMVNAPNVDQPVQVSHYRWRGDAYLGATRPAATGERRTGLLEFLTAPRTLQNWPRSFDAPRAAAPVERVQPSFALPTESETAAASVAAAEGRTVEGPATQVGADATVLGPRATAAAWRPSAARTIPSAEHQARTASAAGRPAADLSGADRASGEPVLPSVGESGENGPLAAQPAAAASPGVRPGAAGPVALPAGTRPVSGPSDADSRDGAVVLAAPAVDAVVGTLTLPTGPVPLVAARLDLLGAPVPPAPGTAALLDEGGAQLVVLSVPIPLDDAVIVAIDGTDPRERTVVEAQTLTAEQLAQHVRTLPEGEFQIATASPDGTWSVAELE